MKDFRELLIWRRCHAITLEVYRLTQRFLKEEAFGMIGQMRRAAASMAANIAEGCGRDGDAELKRFLTIALGSACELDYFILLAGDLAYLPRDVQMKMAGEIFEIRSMLGAFVRKLKA